MDKEQLTFEKLMDLMLEIANKPPEYKKNTSKMYDEWLLRINQMRELELKKLNNE